MADARALLVVFLVALAGCNGGLAAFGGAGDAGPATPPGVNGDDVNASVLLDAHVASLANESFSAALDTGSVERDAGLDVRVDGDTARVRQRLPAAGNASLFVSDGRAYWQVAGGGERNDVVSNWGASRDRAVHDWYAAPPFLRQVLGVSQSERRPAPEMAVNGTVERGNRTVWRLTLSASNATRRAGVTDVAGEAVVTPEGRILEFTYRFTRGDTRVAFRYDLTDVGETDVAHPGWVADARRHGEYRGFGADQRRVTREVFERDSLVTVVGVSRSAGVTDLDTTPIATSDDPLAPAVVGWYAYVRYDGDYDHAFVTLDYNESALPADASESELALYRLPDGAQTFERLDASLDARENQLSARVEDVDGIYVVFHAPTYERLVDDLENQTA